MSVDGSSKQLDVDLGENHLHLAFGSPRRGLSSAVLNGGLPKAEHVVNLKVGKHTVFGEHLALAVIEALQSSIGH